MSSNGASSSQGEDSALSNTYKRAFDQIDLDVEELEHTREQTPSSSSGSSRTPERHKRARSETRSEDEPVVAAAGEMDLRMEQPP